MKPPPPRTRLAPGAGTLATAARAVAAVAAEGRSADAVLAGISPSPERAAMRAVALGTLRWYLRLAPAIGALLARPAFELPPPVHALLIVGAHQIEYSRSAVHSSVHLAVDASRALGHAHLAGLVNAVLRRFAAGRAVLLARVDADMAARTAHPPWLVDAIGRDWPGQAARVLEANNVQAPMTLRVDLQRGSAPEYVRELAGADIAARCLTWRDSAVELIRPMNVADLPGFPEGRVSVQDAGAQLAAPLLDAQPGMRVLDACAAPGGKTGHLLEHTPGLAVLVAVDSDSARLARVRANLERLGREAQCVHADLRDLRDSEALRGAPFDRILVDAPCSATGVIRRHPDIKLLRREDDPAVLAATQLSILRSCFARLAAGGRLVYSTCSLLRVENDAVIGGLLASERTARVLAWPAAVPVPPGAVPARHGMQLLPGAEADTDGFYYACLEKAAGTTA